MSSGVTLSAATRQNLLSLQDTAALTATTQNRLSTGKKVNSAIDNATNFFTAAALTSRSNALTTLLDGIGNGIQTIKAANQGITNIQKLTAQLKSTAQQALSASNAFTAKDAVTTTGSVSTNAAGKLLGGAATAASSLGDTAFASATFQTQTASSVTSNVNLGTATAPTVSASNTYTAASITEQTPSSATSAVNVTATPSSKTGTVAVADDTALVNLRSGSDKTITFTAGGQSVTYTVGTSSTKAALTAALSQNGFTAEFDVNNFLKVSRTDGVEFTPGGADVTTFGHAATISNNGTTADESLQSRAGTIALDDGYGHTVSYTVDGTSTVSGLLGALGTNGYSATRDATTGAISITRADGNNFTRTGTSPLFTGNGTGGVRADAADTFSLTVGATTVNFAAVSTGANAGAGSYTDLNSLVAAINASSIGAASATAGKVTASIDSNRLVLTGGAEGTSFTVGGTSATKQGITAGAKQTALQAFAGQTLTFDDNNGNAVSYAVTATSTQAQLLSALGANGYTATIDASTHVLKVERADGRDFNGSGAAAGSLSVSGNTDGGAARRVNGTTAAEADKFTLTVGGTTREFKAVATGADPSAGVGTFTTLANLVDAINNSSIGTTTSQPGRVTASIEAGKLKVTSADTTTAFTAGGAVATKLAVPTTATNPLQGLLTGTLSVTVGDGTASLLTFGPGGVQSLEDLNAALESKGARAAIDPTTKKLSISTTNEFGAKDVKISGTIARDLFGAADASTDLEGTGLTLGGDGKAARTKLVKDYNNLLTQIDQLGRDSGFNGVNLLAGDTVKVVFNEKNTSSIEVKGASTDAASLGLSALAGAEFDDVTAINKVLDTITTANANLQSQAATFGTNLSIVQNRQDFSKNLINILDEGSANLTSADLNEEAANSQALVTRQSLSISALGLANQAQQGILQLLR